MLMRMTNPYLADAVDRAGRDALRKLGLNDRLFGTMRLALEQDIHPRCMALGAAAAILHLQNNADSYAVPQHLRFVYGSSTSEKQVNKLLSWIWKDASCKQEERLIALTHQALQELDTIVGVA